MPDDLFYGQTNESSLLLLLLELWECIEEMKAKKKENKQVQFELTRLPRRHNLLSKLYVYMQLSASLPLNSRHDEEKATASEVKIR